MKDNKGATAMDLFSSGPTYGVGAAIIASCGGSNGNVIGIRYVADGAWVYFSLGCHLTVYSAQGTMGKMGCSFAFVS